MDYVPKKKEGSWNTNNAVFSLTHTKMNHQRDTKINSMLDKSKGVDILRSDELRKSIS